MTAFLTQTLLPALLNMSLTGGIVILCVLAARLALKRAPKVFSYALWAVVLFRLLCPVSLSAGFSLLGALNAPTRQASPVVSTLTYIRPAQPAEVLPQTDPLPAEPEEPVSQPGSTTAPVTPERTSAPVDWAAVAAWAWLAGAAALAGYSLVALLRLRRRLVGVFHLEDNIYLADYISTPFVLGLVRPRIYLPSTLTRRELDYIIRHEQYHICHGDHVVKLLAFAALCLHWFNPLVWVAFVLAGRDMEMRCDEAVVKAMGEEVKADYSASLLHLATGRLSVTGTPLAFGEGDPKGRIRNLLGWKRPRLWLSVAAGLACGAVIAACAANPAGQSTGGSGRYESMEDFAQQTMAEAKEVTYTPLIGGVPAQEGRTAQVTGTKLARLDKMGELDELAPEGTLEAWVFQYLVQIDVPPEQVALAGGMYEEDGWFDLEGQGGRNIVSLRYPDGSYDILYDGPVNDNMSFYGWHNSYEEAVYDWYVGEQALDLPLYVKDWGEQITYPEGTEPGSYPVHRYDGDGWYLYLPVEGWTQWTAGDTNWFWTSDYCSGFTLTVEHITTNLADALAGETQGMTPADDSRRIFTAQRDGWVYQDRYVDAVDGGCWKLSTKWFDPDLASSTSAVSPAPGPMAPIHRQALALMAESFTPDNRITPTQTSASLLTGVTAGETPLTLTLLPEDGQTGDGLGDCWSCGNSRYFYSELAALTWRAYSAPAGNTPKGAGVTLTGPGWALTAYESYPAAAFDDGSGLVWLKPDGAEEANPYQLLRGWYDEVEFQALGGGFDNQAQTAIPDSGQDYLRAAEAYCTAVEQPHLQASPGGSLCWSYVQCVVSPVENDIPAFQDLPDNVYPFYLATIFVPENENALAHAMAGNTVEYTGSDPSVPEGAYEYGLCGFVTLEADGWHGNIVGTGW